MKLRQPREWSERRQWAAAALLALLLMGLSYACCRVLYETNDDTTIVCAASGVMTGVPAAGNGFTTYLYGLMLSALYRLFPLLPWHGLGLIGLSWLSVAALAKCFFQEGVRHRVSPGKAALLFGCLYLGVMLPFIVLLQFTAVAALAACAGASLLLSARSRRARAVQWPLGAVLLIWGLLLRVQSAWVSVPLLAGYVLLQEDDRRAPICAAGCIIAAMALLTVADHQLYRALEPGWDAYEPYNEALTTLLDYNNTPLLERVATEELNWPSWSVYMLRNWYQLDERLTTENLTRLAGEIEAQKPPLTVWSVLKATGSAFRRMPLLGGTFVCACALALWACIRHGRAKRWRDVLRATAPLIYLLLFVAFFYGVLGRMPGRVLYTAACPCYAACALHCLPALRGACRREHAALLGLAALLAVSSLMGAGQRLPLRWQAQSRDEARRLSLVMMDHVREHPDRVYVTDLQQEMEPLAVYGPEPPCRLVEWCTGIFASPIYQQKLQTLGFASFCSRTLLEEPVDLLLTDELILHNLRGYLQAEYGEVEVEILGRPAGLVECRIRLCSAT